MAKVTQKQLEKQLKMLKAIKPNKEWALLLKSQIVSRENANDIVAIEAQKAGFVNTFSTIFSTKSLLYSCAVMLFLVAGFAGYLRLATPSVGSNDLAVHSQAALTSPISLAQNIDELKNNIDSLTQATKEGKEEQISSTVLHVSQSASQLAKTLKEQPVEDSKTINEIAISLKVLADVQGADLAENPEVESLYKTIVESQIADFEKATLSEKQTETLLEATNLYKTGNYTGALELLLLINQ